MTESLLDRFDCPKRSFLKSGQLRIYRANLQYRAKLETNRADKPKVTRLTTIPSGCRRLRRVLALFNIVQVAC